MGFLIRRNLPKAWAGYYDGFQRADENPVQPPWRHLGDGDVTKIVGNQLKVHGNYASSNGGGPTYQWQPFTSNWGAEISFGWPVSGLAPQQFCLMFSNSWTQVDASFTNVVLVYCGHEVAAQTVQYQERPNPFASAVVTRSWSSPVSFGATNPINLRVWVENDEWIRIWTNGTYVGSVHISSGYRPAQGRRCLRILNASLTDAYVYSHNHYDRPSTVPPLSVWSSIFYDDFNRSDGAVGNGWTQLGTDAGIVSNRYTHTGTGTNSVGLIRDVGDLAGRARIEAIVRSPSSAADGSLMLFCNSAGTQALVANIYSNHIYLGRMTSSVNGTPSFSDFQDIGVTVADGDKLAFSVYSEICWLEINDVPVLYAGNVHDVVPDTNQYAGLRVRRDGSDGVKFDDVRIYSGIGI